jgi:uncharacterized membrane protein
VNGHETPPQGAWSPQQTASATQPAGTPTQDDCILAAVAHGLTFFEGGLIGPLILYLVKKDQSDFVAFHALQSLYFGFAFFAVTVLTCGLGAVLLVWPYVIFEAIATLKAYQGEWYELPFVGRYAREKHPGHSVAPAAF